jgi:hypothetical protein
MAEDDKPSIGGPANAKGINGLVLNVIVPGLGTLLYGKTEIGVGQLLMAVLGIPVLFKLSIFLGLAMLVGAWIWSIVVGWQMFSAATE